MTTTKPMTTRLLAVLLAVLLAGPAVTAAQDDGATPTDAATPTGAAAGPVEFLWEATGGPVPLDYPMDVTVAPDGDVWVVDIAHSQFQIFSPEGEFVEAWGSEGDDPGEFDFFAGPVAEETEYGGDFAFDNEGNIYVADLANSRVQKFAPDRTFVAEWTGGPGGDFARPWSLDVDDRGNVNVADYGRTDVRVFNRDGTYLRTLAEAGTGEGDLTDVAPVIVDPDGNVWVSNYDAKLLKFSPEGVLLVAVDRYGSGPGEFNIPNVGAADGGFVYVPDVVNHRIQVLDGAGRYVAAWGSEGDGPGEFSYPVGVALDGEGGVYVADIGNDRIQKFRLLPPLAPGGATPVASPAVAQTGTPAAGVTVETLLEATFPAEELPTGSTEVYFFRDTYEPGAEWSIPSEAPSVSVGFEYVVAGTYAARLEGRMLVLRAGAAGTPGVGEEMPPGMEAVLHPGDAVVYLDYDAAWTGRNPGTETTVVMGAGIYSTVQPATPVSVLVPEGLRSEQAGFLGSPGREESGLAGEAVTIRLERVTVAPGAELPPERPDPARPVLRMVEAGEAEWRVGRAEELATPGYTGRYRAGQSVPFFVSRDIEALVELRNPGDEPLVLLALTLARAEGSAATPAA